MRPLVFVWSRKTQEWEYVELILMAAQDHFTKYCWLRILDEHTAYAVSNQYCSIDHECQDDSVYLEIQDWFNYHEHQDDEVYLEIQDWSNYLECDNMMSAGRD